MNPDTYVEWLRRQGHKIFITTSSYWYTAGPRVLQAFPHHWLIEPSLDELNQLMIKNKIIALRYSTPLSAPSGKASYHMVLNPPYNLEMLKSQARNGVKRGLNRFSIERISFSRLAEEGWLIQKDTLERQGRQRSMTKREWHSICTSAEGLPGFEAWGALCDGRLASALITALVDDVISVPYALSHHDYLRDHVNNAIFYAVCTKLLERQGIRQIFFNTHSLDAPESVDEFKLRMNFQPKPVRQCVIFHPWLAALANPTTHSIIRTLHQRNPADPLLAKTEGMLRFHLEGKLQLAKQTWPACLEETKNDLLARLKINS